VVGIARDEASAVRQAAAGNPDLVLMDIRLANSSDGIETAKLMRTRAPVAVIFLSANLDGGTRQRAAALNPLGYLVKPYSRNQLLETITVAQAAVEGSKARGDAGAVP
jgi:DNA-binding NarL/FixJ family response regulator